MEQLSTFYIGNELFGINILHTKEITKIHGITCVPETPSFVYGLMNLRGQIVTVIKPAELMGQNQNDINETSRLLIIKTKDQAEILAKRGLLENYDLSSDPLAILIDEIGDVVEYHEEDLAPVPPHIKESYKDYVSGVVQLKNKLVIQLNIEKLKANIDKAMSLEK